ncbi:MAG: acetyltransferase [Isosphaeraceae bacterium]
MSPTTSPRQIVPLRLEDVPELGRFLAEGFHAPPDAEFAAPDVLRWKYLEPWGVDDGPRSYLVHDDGRIIGHVGCAVTNWRVAGKPGAAASTLHMMDWLGSPAHPGVGVSLLRQTHRRTETHYGLGGSLWARRLDRASRYEVLGSVPVFQKVLRPGYRLRSTGGTGPTRRVLASARDLVRMVRQRGETPARRIGLRRVETFGNEVEDVLGRVEPPLVFTDRRPSLLNAILRYPRTGLTGWLLEIEGQVVGFALLALKSQGKARVGKVVECFLTNGNPDLWHSSFDALANELRDQGADVALAIGSVPRASTALARAGFTHAHDLEFHLHDRARTVPRDQPFHLTFLEADYAYT